LAEGIEVRSKRLRTKYMFDRELQIAELKLETVEQLREWPEKWRLAREGRARSRARRRGEAGDWDADGVGGAYITLLFCDMINLMKSDWWWLEWKKFAQLRN
jgi:hypothetical protein